MRLVGVTFGKSKTGKDFAVLKCELPFNDYEIKNGALGTNVKEVMVFEGLVQKIKDSMVGKKIEVKYDCGYQGKAYVNDIVELP